MLQKIVVDEHEYSLFYDTGCSEMVSRYEAVKSIGSRAVQEQKGPILLGGVGNSQIVSNHGVYQISLPLFNGEVAKLSGVCMDKITARFPMYPLQGKVEEDIKAAYRNSGKDVKLFPRLPVAVGGDTDFMIGIKYYRYYPELVFQLPSGLSIYNSWFLNPDGSRGVIGGPHAVFTRIEAKHYDSKSFISSQYALFRFGYQVNPDVSLLHFKEDKDFLIDPTYSGEKEVVSSNDEVNQSDKDSFITRAERKFQMVEDAGSEISYRCSNCRNCKNCKNHENIENVSLREEVEQDLINRSVAVDVENRVTIASLPFIHNPSIKLADNKGIALRVYNQQLKKLDKNPQDKLDVLKSEAILQSMNHVEYVENLPPEDQEMLRSSTTKYYIPWRIVWKQTSVTTPCRPVFDASQSTSTGFSLNDCLAKGKNNMNRLLEIVIRWCSHAVAFSTDITKMYNSVQLRKEDWCYQRYIWQENLDKGKLPVEKVIKTLIYGVRPSGNQAERGIRETARLSQKEYPEISRTVNEDMYVDDCLSGGRNKEEVLKLADDLEIVLNRGGFSLKGVTFSGEVPPENLSSDGININVAGLKWNPLKDVLSLDISKLNFAKKVRGKKPVRSENVIPDVLTRRHCVSKVGEIFDLMGKITPITSMMKIDLHELITRQLDWDDAIPDELRPLWTSHFEMMEEIGTLQYKRTIIPDDASNLNIETIDFGDASIKICCSAIYARILKKDGTYSSQLVFSRSKIIPNNTTQPRAELLAAVLNTHTGEVVRRSFGKHHQGNIKVTDSQIVLYWIHNDTKPLKQWVRNRIVEIQRFTKPSDWRYTQSKTMLADIGTRRVDDLKLVDQNSVWINGFDWMKYERRFFPFQSIEQIKLNNKEVGELRMESLISHDNNFDVLPMHHNSTDVDASINVVTNLSKKIVPEEVQNCSEFSNYLISPNRHRFKTVVRIMALVIRFIKLLKGARNNSENRSTISDISAVIVSDEEVKEGKDYFFRKATNEVKEFMKVKEYESISDEKSDILYYSGRILPTEPINVIGQMTDVMKDLCSTTFCVPLVYKHSPLAYSIVNDIHWYSDVAKHSGIETTLRYVLKEAFIVGGRELIKKVRTNCQRCRYLKKKFIDVEMGPVSTYNLTIAPPFYNCQVDLAGPFKAYDSHSKRKTIKIWFTVFCCATTSTVNIKVMDDYSTSTFILAFIRLACEVGYPKLLLIDDGSQLVKGCETMKLDFTDMKKRLHKEMAVDFEVCPVGGHNVNGKVERRIRHIRESLEHSVHDKRLSILQWETTAAEIANAINDLPLALGNIVADYENMDLLTPNRLRLGRNNDRSPIFPMEVVDDPKRMMKENEEIINTWFEVWLVSYVPKLMNKPKWFTTERDMQICDVVLFLKQEGALAKTYQYGMIHQVERGKDGLIRKALVKYRNSNENFDRFTRRSVRQLVIIHPVDELNLMEELSKMNYYALHPVVHRSRESEC